MVDMLEESKSKGRGKRVCEECGGYVGRDRLERDVEGWIWCRKCGLVENDGRIRVLDGMSVEGWIGLVKRMRGDLKKSELKRVGKVRRVDRLKVLRQLMN